MNYPIIAFIGAGKMATAVITGLIQNAYPAEKIIAANPTAKKLQQLSDKFGISTTDSNSRAIQQAELVVLAVKPAVIQKVCNELSTSIQPHQMIISIAAGKTIASIKKFLSADNPVIRVMPNTPCLLSKGSIGMYAEDKVSEDQKHFVGSLFANIGEVFWLNAEQQIDVVTALSGSGPAYYFYLTEALIKAGVELGLDETISTRLVNQTAVGAIAMLTHQPLQSASSLRQDVTSPKGTTAAAINVFDENQLMPLISTAIGSATDRAKEMSVDDD